MIKNCVTHHDACDCRRELITRLVQTCIAVIYEENSNESTHRHLLMNSLKNDVRCCLEAGIGTPCAAGFSLTEDGHVYPLGGQHDCKHEDCPARKPPEKETP